VGQSFSAARIAEDNLMSQAASQGWRIAFAGDDTWMQLIPADLFTVAEPYPSFNILDLHTVDDGVWKVRCSAHEGYTERDRWGLGSTLLSICIKSM
jgi:predicted AlkP superfamily pyrophosphatase or phosphodiesterase